MVNFFIVSLIKTAPANENKEFYAGSLGPKGGPASHLKGLSHEIDFKNVDENGQILALTRAAAGF